jgi:sialate O-acetylesterase
VKKNKLFFLIGFLTMFVSSAVFAQNDIQLPYFFGDNMVLQCQKPIKIWGTAVSRKAFEIQFRGERKKVKPNALGRWEAVFKPAEAGGPYEMVFSGGSPFTLKNILIGDVWFCSGQSNMEMRVLASFNSGYELRNANNPEIRSINVNGSLSSVPLTNIAPSQWEVSTPGNTAFFTAVGYFFARHIHQWEKVPIGIIHDSWGGTVIEAWTGMESLRTHPDYKEKVAKLIAARNTPESFDTLLLKTENADREWQKKVESIDQGFLEKWQDPNFSPAGWDTLIAPGYWENQGLKDFDGVVWMRKEFNVPPSMANRNLVVNLELINNTDHTFFNGTQIGSVQWPLGRRIYYVPAKLVKEGKNVIVIRVMNSEGYGGFNSKNAADLRIQEAAESDHPLIVPLSGEWLYKPTLSASEIPQRPTASANNAVPSSIYNAMVAPFASLSIKGILWYQGESNSWRAWQYRTLFPLLINDWRKQFNQGNLPFIFVQLSGYGPLKETPVESSWAELRESQAMALSIPQTGMAVTFDIGNPYDVHPTNKQEVGRRLAMEAQKLVYGKSTLQTSPVYKSMRIEGNKVYLQFTNSDNGLASKNGELKGFAIAGSDKKFVWAKALIQGNEVIVTADQIVSPVAVRYAWAASPFESYGANLYNKEDFPASPFRTDDWDGETINNK